MWRHKQKPRGKNKYLMAKKNAHDGNKNKYLTEITNISKQIQNP